MNKNIIQQFPSFKMEILTIQDNDIKRDKIFMGSRVCDNCGKTKNTYGGKSCSKGHFICHSCASNHIHCPFN